MSAAWCFLLLAGGVWGKMHATMSTFSRFAGFIFVALALIPFSLSGEETRLASAEGSLANFTPLGFLAEKSRENADSRVRGLEAELALLSGLPSLAEELSRKELEEKSLSNAERDRLLLTLSGAQIARGEYALAAASVGDIAGNSAQKHLRTAFLAVTRGEFAEAEKQLAGLFVEAFPRQEQSWFFFVRALSEFFLGKKDAANVDFDAAEENALSASEREHIAFVRQWANVVGGESVSDEELDAMKTAREAARFTPAFAEAGKLYAVALAKSGNLAGAREALTEVSPVPAKETADFALLEGLWAENPGSDVARTAFLRVINERPPRARQSAALSGLLRNVIALNGAGKKEEAILAANGIEDFLGALTPDESVRDLELFTRARIASEVGDFRRAESLTEELLSRFPASPFVSDALRLLTGIAIEAKEFRRAVALLERLRATALAPEEILRADILIADCNFLSGDYALAADAYARVSEGETSTMNRENLGGIFFQRVYSEIRSGNVLAAVELLDSPIAARVPAGWMMRAECAVIEGLQQAGRWEDAAARAKKFLARTDLLTDFRIRILWTQALLALDLNDPEIALRNADLISVLASEPNKIISEELQKTASELVSRSVLLKARALFLLGKQTEALSLLADLRERYPDSASAVVSWLEEGRRFHELGKPDRALVCYETLIDRYGAQEKFAEYFSIAAFEAAQAAATIGRPEEAVKQMQTLISRYPKSPLAFYARMRQADFFRVLNDFDSALAVYDNLIAAEADRPEMRIVEMRRADTLRALAARAEGDANARGTFLDALSKAKAAYERLFSLPDQPLSLKAEAGFKWGYAEEDSVPEDGDPAERERAWEQARTIYWKTASEIIAAAQKQGEITPIEGGYWVSRCLFALAGSYEKSGDYESARNTYEKAREWGELGLIPGKNYAEQRCRRIFEK